MADARDARIRQLLLREQQGKLSPEEQHAVDTLRRAGEFPQPLPAPSEMIGQGLIQSGMGTGVPVQEPRLDDLAHAPIPFAMSTAGSLAGRRLGPLGSAVGAGIGAAGGAATNALVFGEEMPTLGELFKIAGGAALADLTGSAVVGAGRFVGSRMSIAPRPDVGPVRQAFRETGVTPKVTDLAGGRLPSMVEQGVRQMPSGQAVTETVERQGAQLRRAADEFLARLGGPEGQSAVQTGQKASASILRQVERTKGVEDHLWTQLRQMAHDTPVPTAHLKRVAKDVLLEQERRLPAQRNAKLVSLANDVLKAGDEVSWQAADAWRRGFGEMVESGELISNVPGGAAKAMYGAVLRDMESVAAKTPNLQGVYENVRAFSARRRQAFRDGAVAKLMETDPEKVPDLLNAAGGPTAVKRARETILGSPELGLAQANPDDVATWNLVRRHILEGVFAKGVDANPRGLMQPILSGANLERELKKIGKETLDELLSPTERKALENIVTVAKTIRQSERIAAVGGTSATPQGVGIQGAIVGLGAGMGGAMGSVMGGGVGAGAGATMGAYFAWLFTPAVLARALTHPRGAELIASPTFRAAAATVRAGGQLTGEALRLTTRLGGILAAQNRVQTGRDLDIAEE